MLGREQSHQLDAGRGRQHVHSAAAVGRPAGLIGDEADALAGERGEAFRRQYINPCEHSATPRQRRGARTAVAGQSQSQHRQDGSGGAAANRL